MQEALAQEVDSSRIALWGTSFAGGHVLVKGAELAEDWRIRAIVSQAGQPCSREARGKHALCGWEGEAGGRLGKQAENVFPQHGVVD